MIYRFEDCEIDTKLLELRRSGDVEPMDPLGFDLLRYLIENRDRVLTRDELLDALWPGKVVTDSALSSRLKDVRSAVGDDGTSQRVVKTVHGRGYRFVADIVGTDEEVPSVRAGAPAPAGGESFAGAAPAVGRDTELGKLARWLDRASTGERALVLISGEAGVGKTTLTRAFLGAAQRAKDIFVVHGQCVNQRGASEAYLPLLEGLGRAGQRDPRVVDLLARHAPAWLGHLSALARTQVEAPLSHVGVTQGRMLRELSDFLDRLAVERTVVLVLEDLHWSDPSTLAWLEYHARRIDPARLLLVATLRPVGEVMPLYGELTMRGLAHGLALDAIDEACVSDYLNQRLDRPPSPQLAALTFRRTGGFPLFIDTLVDHWLENGLVHRANGIWSAAADDKELVAGVPDSLSQLIDRQLQNLQENERQLLAAAALAGTPFAAAAVAHALEASAETIESHYGRLARQGRIVRNTGDARWPDGTITATFEFRHELYREALYAGVSPARRARLHRALGERLEQAFGDAPSSAAGEIADHFARAHEVGRALRYFYPAALLAFNRSANRETVALVDRAVKLIGTLEGTPDTRRAERDLLLLRASALIALEGWASARVEQSYRRALELGDELGLRDNWPEIYGMAAVHELRGRYAESQAVIESLLERTSEAGPEARELLACSLFHQGRFDQSISSAEQAVAEFDPEEVSAILARYGENPGVCCHSWIALGLWYLGRPEASMRRSDQALALAQDHPYSLSSALTYRTFLHQFRGEPEATLQWSQQTCEVAERQGFVFRVAQASMAGAWAAGRLASAKPEQDAALARMRVSLEDHKAMGAEMDVPYYLTLQADLLFHMGRVDESIATLERAFAANPPGRAFFFEAEMHRLHARLVLARQPGDTERAGALLDRALAVARAQSARMLELRACMTRLELGIDQNGAARKALARALDSLEEVGSSPEGQAARALLGAAQKKRPARTASRRPV